jgi:hypothetical protein
MTFANSTANISSTERKIFLQHEAQSTTRAIFAEAPKVRFKAKESTADALGQLSVLTNSPCKYLAIRLTGRNCHHQRT